MRRPALVVLLGTAIIAALLPLRAPAAHAVTTDVLEIKGNLDKFAQWSSGLADTGFFGEPLKYSGLVPGGPGGVGLANLFAKTVTDRWDAAGITTFDDINKLAAEHIDVGDDRDVGMFVVTNPVQPGSTQESFTIGIVANRTVDRPLDIESTNPKVSFHSPTGFDTTVFFAETYTFIFDTQTLGFFLVDFGPAAPEVEMQVHASVDKTKIDAGIGLLKVHVTDAAFNTEAFVHATIDDPNRDGTLAFDEPALPGQFVPGELATTLPNDLVHTTFDVGQVNASFGGILFDGGSLPGQTVAIPQASIQVQDDITTTDDDATAVTTNAFGASLERFQTLTPQDLADGIDRLAVAIQGIQRARLGADSGDVDLPWLKGSLADAVPATETLLAFLKNNTDANGKPTFSSLQSFLDELDSTTSGNAHLDVTSSAFDDATSQFTFTIHAEQATGSHLLNEGLDETTGDVQFGDAFSSVGLTGASSDTKKTSTATVAPRYGLDATLVLDLRMPTKGAGCTTFAFADDPTHPPSGGQECPFTQNITSKAGQVIGSTVVQELPTAADRILLHTGASLLTANSIVTAPVADVAGTAGFLQVALNGGNVVVGPAGADPLASIALKPQIGTSVRLTTLADKIASAPSTLLTYVTKAKASATGIHASVPMAPGFFNGSDDSAAVQLADVFTPAQAVVTAPGLNARLKPFLFDATNPAALRGKVTNSISVLIETLQHLSTQATGAANALQSPIQMIGQPFGSFARTTELEAALADITSTPPDNLQALVTALRAHLGNANASFALTGANLVLTLRDTHDLSLDPKPILGLRFNSNGQQTLTGTDADGRLAVGGSSDANIDLVVPLDTTNATDANSVKVLETSTVDLKPTVTVSGQTYQAEAGLLHAQLGPGATIDARPTLTLAHTGTTITSLATWASGATATIGNDPGTSCGHAICAHLPSLTQAFDVDLTSANALFSGDSSGITVPSTFNAAQTGAEMKLSQSVDGLAPYFANLKGAMGTATFDGKLPLVGNDVQEGTQFVNTLQTNLTKALGGIPSTAKQGLTVGQYRTQVSDALNTVGNKTPNPVTLTCSPACADGNSAITITKVVVDARFGQGTVDNTAGCNPCQAGTPQKFTIGIPAVQLSTTQAPTIGIGWNLHVIFGIDHPHGFFIDTTPNDELAVGVNVKMPTFDGNVAFIKVHVTDNNGATPEFAGVFALDAHAQSNILTQHDLANGANPASLFTTQVAGDVKIDWHLVAGTDSNLPGIATNFVLGWHLPSAVSTMTIRFSDVTLDLQPLFEQVLGPIFETVKKAIGPLKPIIDALSAPIPGISDISRFVGGGDISLITLIQEFGSLSGDASFDALARVIKLVATTLQITETISGDVKLGQFSLEPDQAFNAMPTPDQMLSLIKTGAGTLAKAVDLINDPQQCRTCQGARDALGTIASIALGDDKTGFHIPMIEKPEVMMGVLLGQDVPLATFDSGTFSAKFSWDLPLGPIFIPIPVLIKIGAAAEVTMRFRAGFDTYGIRKAFESGGATPKLIDSFYLQDFDENGVEMPEITIARAGPYVKGVATLAVIEAGVGASIALDANLDLHDADDPQHPNVAQNPPGHGDGKVRISELGRDRNGNFDVGCLFDVSGGISADLYALLTIHLPLVGGEWRMTLAKVMLLELRHECTPRPDPKLGEMKGNDLFVFAGKLGDEFHRQSGWGNNVDPQNGADEKVTVRALHEPNDIGGDFRGFSIDMLGYHQEFLGLDPNVRYRVIVDGRGYGGKETIELLGDGSGGKDDPAVVHRFDQDATVIGGNNDDQIKVDGTGNVAADGGPGTDVIITGSGNDTVSGGAGKDIITTLRGNDSVWGDAPLTIGSNYVATAPTRVDRAGDVGDDVDQIDVGIGADYANGNDGGDFINGGTDDARIQTDANNADYRDGPNTLVGGFGADHIAGGPHTDTIYGDEQQNLGENEAGDTGGGSDAIDTGKGDDTVYAGNGRDSVRGESEKGVTVDHLYGNGGRDELTAGEGDDFVYGGPDDDGFTDAQGTHGVRGGGGDDQVYGDDGNDIVAGDSQYPPAPGSLPTGLLFRWTPGTTVTTIDGSDHVYGGHGEDAVYGGGADDRVYGDTGRADCDLPASTLPRSTPPTPDGETGDGIDRVIGGAGNDHLSGEGGGDVMEGETGDDVMCGHAGNDTMSGQDGNDIEFGGDGIDTMYGDYGNDHLYGNDKHDIMSGGPGDDVAEGNVDDDLIFGDAGDDHLEGNQGPDSVFGLSGQDDIFGGTSPDAVAGGSTASNSDVGDPVLYGGGDADVIVGDNGAIARTGAIDSADGSAVRTVSLLDVDTVGGPDHIYGDKGNDRAFGEVADDTLEGGPGDDHLEGNGGRDSMYGLSATDDGTTPFIGNDQDDMIGGSSSVNPTADKLDSGELVMLGNREQDVMIGDNGEITRPTGTDGKWTVDPDTGGWKRTVTLFDRTRTGDALAPVSGGDLMQGNDGNDRMFGEGGNDAIKGNADDDFEQGNQGGDLVEGNDGEDDLIGGSVFTSAPGIGDPDSGDFVYGGGGADVITGDNAVITRIPPNPATPQDYITTQLGIVHRRAIALLDKGAPPASANSGGDQLSGGSGVDVLFGQDGDDWMSGGSADDYMQGNGGTDREYGDRLLSDATVGAPAVPSVLAAVLSPLDQREGTQGAAGQDDMIGGSSIKGFRDAGDFMYGDGAADFQLGDNGELIRTIVNGAYTKYAEANVTTVVRQPNRFDVAGAASTHGNDYMEGNAGDDYMWGQDGDDEMHGGTENDDMYGELGNDRMLGEAGQDAMIGDRGVIVDRYVDGSAGDPASFTVNVTPPPAISYTAFVNGSIDRRVDLLTDGDGDMNGDGNPVESPGLTVGGNDFMRGGSDHDSMHGAFGDDIMNGDSGGDTLFGDDGSDVMWGGQGSDDPNNPNDRGANDRYVDYLFGGHGGDPTKDTGVITGGADILDFRPRPGIDPQSWFDATSTNSSDPVSTHQHHQGIDWIYGGWDRDVLQGDVADNGPNPGDRLLDWTGAYNLYTHCNAAYGGFNDVRQFSPAMQDFLERLAYGVGVGSSLADVQKSTSSAYRELALVYSKDAKQNSASAYPTTPGHFDQISCAP